MKTKPFPLFGLFGAALVSGLISCNDACKKEMIYEANVPVYLSYEELRQPVTFSATESLRHPGKFWRKDGYLFVGELNRGIHIYNILDVNHPYEVVFVNVPGVVDIAVKDQYLLADSYTDLLVLNVSNPAMPNEVKRLPDVFPYNAFKVAAHEGYPVVNTDPAKGVVTGWKLDQVKDEYACSGGNATFYTCTTCDMMSVANNLGGGSPPVFSGGGSLAAFAVTGNYLYAVDERLMHTYSIADPANPVKTSEQSIGWNIETIIAYQRYLFVGTRTGLQIFDIQNPAVPAYVGGFSHATACDPVVVQNQTAYVTLRSGTACQNASNQLDILDVAQIQSPNLLRSYPMNRPHGLGIDGQILAICEAEFGVSIFNAADPLQLVPVTTIPSLRAKDVIMYQGVALFIGDSGIWIYTYDAAGHFQGGGSIPVTG